MRDERVEEIAAFAAELPEKFLLCRELGHLWRPYDAHWDTEHNCYVRVLRCTRCYTRRHQNLSSLGGVLASHYEYVDGYQSKGLGRIEKEGRDRLRLESITRTIASNGKKATGGRSSGQVATLSPAKKKAAAKPRKTSPRKKAS